MATRYASVTAEIPRRFSDFALASSRVALSGEERASEFWSGMRKVYNPEINTHARRNEWLNLREASDEQLENALTTKFARHLGDMLSREFQNRSFDRAEGRRNEILQGLVFGVRNIRYASLHFDLVMPNIDGALELIGENLDFLQCILGAYIPQAFSDVYGVPEDFVNAKVDVKEPVSPPPPVPAAPITNPEERKQAAARVVVGAIQSPLVFPILLILALWYFARQDAMQERQMLNSLMTTLLQQQTETIKTLKEGARSTSTKNEDAAASSTSPKASAAKPTGAGESKAENKN